MTQPIPTDALKQAMAFAAQGCPDGGVAYCFDCAGKFVQAVLNELDVHAKCLALPEFPINREDIPSA